MSSGSWARIFDRGVRWAVIVPAIGTFAGAWRSVLSEYATVDLLGQAAILGLGVLQLFVAGLVLRSVRSWGWELAVVMVTAALFIGFVVGRPQSASIEWWPTTAVVLVQCWVLAFGSRHRWWIGTVAVVAFAVIRAWAVLRTGGSWVASVGDVVTATQLPLTVVLGLAAVHKVASRRDEAEGEQVQALAAEAARGAQAARAREVGRFLHDDVSHTLRAIASSRHLEEESLRALAGRSVDQLESGTFDSSVTVGAPERDLINQLTDLAEITGVRVRVSGRAPLLTPDVAEAITAAAAEALRNVGRHSGTDEATIRVRPAKGGVLVSVIDHGRGLPSDVAWGVGIAESMVGRMVEVGGAASVRSSSSGTVVELSWSPQAVSERLVDTWAELSRSMTPMVIPSMTATLIIGLVVLDELANPLLAVLSLLIFAGCGGWTIARGLRLRPMRSYALLVWAAVICFAANVFAVAPDTVNGYHLFMAGGAASLLMLVAIQHRLAWSLCAIIVVWGTMLGLGTLHFGIDLLTGSLFGAFSAPFIAVGIFLPRAILSRFVRRTLGVRDQTLHSRLRAQHLAQRHGAEDARLRRTRRKVLPFLKAIAEDRMNLNETAVVRQAVRLEAIVRDELRFDETEDVFAEAIDEVRKVGWPVEIRVRPEDRGLVVDQAKLLLSALGAKDDHTGIAFLSAFGEVAVVVREPSPEKIAEWRQRADIDLEEGDQWCRLTGRARIRSRAPQARGGEPADALISLERT